MNGPDALIDPILIAPPRVSLINSGATIVPETGERWVSGFQVNPDGCPVAGVIPDLCQPTDLTDPQNNPPLTYVPFGIWAADKCSTFGSSDRDFVDRAKRKLLAVESYLIEQELWDGPSGLDNPHFVDDPNFTPTLINSGDPVAVKKAIAYLEQATADVTKGGVRAVFHMRPYLFTLLFAQDGLIRQEGNQFITPMNNIVIPGRGYSGKGPEGDDISATSEWVYVTSVPRIRRGEIIVIDDNSSYDRRTNDRYVFAERIASVEFDPSCLFLAMQVNPGA